jgi:hypothetical protein
MNIIELYADYSVDFLTEGHKHCREGWVNTPCPWCVSDPGHEGYHLSYNLDDDYFLCWRCGWHPVVSTIAKLINLDKREVEGIVKLYGLTVSKVKEGTKKFNVKPHILPSHAEPLLEHHKRYLEKRGFDPVYLQKEYHLLGTGPVSLLDGLNYKHRIIIPFIWEGREISFDSRDITNKHPYKYMACPLEREIIPHKNILYGKEDKWTEKGVMVEGPTDVWRFGCNSFAVSGIKYTPNQIRSISAHFKRVAVCFDGGETQALIQANKAVAELKFRGVDSFRVDIEGDPGSMEQSEADYLVKQLIK